MSHFLVCLCLIALVVSVSANLRDGHTEEAIKRGDAYIDKLLQEMFDDGNEEYDPYKIEDSIVGFKRTIAFVSVSGQAKLHDGYITGLKTLHRSDHCTLTEENGRLNIKADMGAGVLDFHYSGSVKFMNFGPTINVEGNLAYVEVHMEFTVDSKTGEDGKLEKFVIDDMRGMKVWITGLGPLNWAVNPIITGVTTIFKRFVRNFLETKVKSHIAERVPNFKFPVEGDDTVTDGTTTSSPDVMTETTNESSKTATESDKATNDATETTNESSETATASDTATNEASASTETSSVSESIVTSSPPTESTDVITEDMGDSLVMENDP